MKCFGNRLGRRGFLTVGAVGGFTLADFFRVKAAHGETRITKVKKDLQSVIIAGWNGTSGTFDPKPYAWSIVVLSTQLRPTSRGYALANCLGEPREWQTNLPSAVR